MKICYILPWFPSLDAKNHESQQGLFDYRDVLNFSKRGNQYKVISLKWKGQSEYEEINEDLEVFRIPFYFSFVRYPFPNFNKLIKKIKEINADWDPDIIVYSHTIYLTAFPLIYLKNKINKPVIAITDCIPGINWSYGSKIVDSIAYIHSKTIGMITLKYADGIRLLSSHNYDDIINFGITPDKVAVITRSVDDQVFNPKNGNKGLKKQLKINNDDIIVLFVGRIDLVKGVKYFVEAAKELTHQHENVKFLVVGEGNLRSKYEKETEKYDRIQFLGFRQDVPDLMKIADIFVITSLSEGACNVALEASASSLPLVATKVGEIPEIVLDGKTGFLIDPKDMNVLKLSIQKLIDNPLMRKEMGLRGRERILEKYTEKIVHDKQEEFYTTIITNWEHKMKKKNNMSSDSKLNIQG